MPKEGIEPKGAEEHLSTYERFLLTEYNNIAQAHFNTNSAIATFFKHYLLIVSLPISIALLIFGKESIDLSQKYVGFIIYIIPTVFIVIFFVGFLVMLYIINLDCDAVLYARTVNGIRKYFIEASKLDHSQLKEIVTLPTNINKPKYGGFHSLSFIILAFALINTLYLYIGLLVRCELITCYNSSVNLVSFAVFLLHFIAAKIYISYLEKKHLFLRNIEEPS
jgi:hypothetical protein